MISKSIRRLWIWAVYGGAGVVGLLSVQAATPLEEQQQFADGLYARGLYDLAIREYMALLRADSNYPHLDQVPFFQLF